MQARALLLCGVLAFTLGATPHPAKTPAPQTLRSFVVQMLQEAPVDFGNMLGARKESASYHVTYATLAKFASSCASCKIIDEFAWTGHAENWSLEERWTTSMSAAQVQSYLTSQLTPALKGYTLTKTGSGDYPVFTWRSTRGFWVSVETFNGGFEPRIGHDLDVPAHVLKSPTAADLQALRNEVTNFIALGVGPASDNFASLRGTGKKDALGEMIYPLTISLGPGLTDCTVNDGTVNTVGIADFYPKWTMTCETVAMVATTAQIEPLIHDAMAAALPAGFTVTTDSTVVGLDDYRWDNSGTQVAVEIESFASFTLPKGLTAIGIGIAHFLPAPSPT